MDLPTFWKLLGLGMEADFEKRAWTLTIGPFKATGLKLPTIKALSDDVPQIQRLLSNLFVKSAVMWMDFRHETVPACIFSLNSLEQATAAEANTFSASRKDRDRFLAGLLQVWSGECKKARDRLQSALQDERDPINSGMDINARDEIAPTLGDFRQMSFPAVNFLISLLPEGDPIRIQSVAHLRRSEDDLVRHYFVSIQSISPPDIEPEA